MKLIFIGPQGSGKGTQASFLSKKLNIPNISMGDLLRSAEGDLKKEIEFHINKGNLALLSIVKKLLKQRLEKDDAKNGFILDGFPRDSEQAEQMKDISDIDKVILIEISDNEAVKRISSRLSCKNCGAVFNKITKPPEREGLCDYCSTKLYQRADDYPEAIKQRLNIYHKETKPLLDSYKDKLIVINGEQPIEKIKTEILNKLNLS